MKKYQWPGGIFCIVGILWASLQAGDWLGALFVEQARLEPGEYVSLSDTSDPFHGQPRLAPRVRIRRAPTSTTGTRVRIPRAPVTLLPTSVPIPPVPTPAVPAQMPPTADAERVQALYVGWKKAHGSSVGQLMRYYAPKARIMREVGTVQNYQQLKQLAAQVRANKTFNSVRDMAPPKMGGTRRKIVMRVQHRYGHGNRNHTPLAGTRSLVWRKIKGRWLIVEDVFPKNYTVVK